MHLLLATDGVPILLHLSVFLFFTGLLILLHHIDHTVFYVVVACVMLCVAVYTWITILPIFHPASPHYGPLASFTWQLCAYLFSKIRFLLKINAHDVDFHHSSRLINRLERKAEEVVSKQKPKYDAHILESLVDNLGEDGTQEKFFEAIPGFCHSKSAEDLEEIKRNLCSEFSIKFCRSVMQFLDGTPSPDSVTELVRSRRLLTCLNASHMVLPRDRAADVGISQIILSYTWNELPPSPEIWHILRRWHISKDRLKVATGSCIIARIIASVARAARHDDTWKALARSQLDVTETVLEEYMENGDSVLLANLIKTTGLFSDQGYQFQGILTSISNFSVDGILRTLQQEFCALWNDTVRKSESSADCTFILKEICRVYGALHPTPEAVKSLLPCDPYLPCADPQSPH